MLEQAAATYQMMDQLGKQPEVGHGGNPNGPGMDLEYLKFAEFRKVNPPSFRGVCNPNKADEWMKAMEKVFFILDYTNCQKVLLPLICLKRMQIFGGMEYNGYWRNPRQRSPGIIVVKLGSD